MSTSSRKQRQIQEREGLILEVAREMLLKRGYLGLTMDRVAEATEYSKGTIYQHFGCKEDLIAALLLKGGDLRAALFERAATYAGSSRDRITAIGLAVELFSMLYPHHAQAEAAIQNASIREKASPERLRQLAACEQRIFGVCFGIMRDAIAQGDLVLPSGTDKVEDLVLGLWSMYLGSFTIMAMGIPFPELGFSEPMQGLRRNAEIFLDGMGWKPLSAERDADAIRQRILESVFPVEAREVGLLRP